MTLSDTPIDATAFPSGWDGTGEFAKGETEDYLLQDHVALDLKHVIGGKGPGGGGTGPGTGPGGGTGGGGAGGGGWWWNGRWKLMRILEIATGHDLQGKCPDLLGHDRWICPGQCDSDL